MSSERAVSKPTVTLEDVAKRETANCNTWQHAQGACGQCDFCHGAELVRAAADVVEAVRELEKLPPVITRQIIGRGYVREETPAHQAAAMRLHRALAAFDAISQGKGEPHES